MGCRRPIEEPWFEWDSKLRSFIRETERNAAIRAIEEERPVQEPGVSESKNDEAADAAGGDR